jgi:5-formyltetrahydrofolate cyclo-ligase
MQPLSLDVTHASPRSLIEEPFVPYRDCPFNTPPRTFPVSQTRSRAIHPIDRGLPCRCSRRIIFPIDQSFVTRLYRKTICTRCSKPRRNTLRHIPFHAMSKSSNELAAVKSELRARAHASRRDQPDKERVSGTICRRFAQLPEYQAAGTVMCYVHVRDEVRTFRFLEATIGRDKRIVIPYCVGDDLKLFLLEDMNELATGYFGILEPDQRLRSRQQKHLEPKQLDLVMVPGVAFDASGGRLGHGRGYYDRLLADVRPDTPLVALAFECQLFPRIPMGPHDVYMDLVITEHGTYRRGER